MAFDPAMGDDAGIGLGQLARVPDRPRERDDEQEQRDGCERTQTPGQGAERQQERQDVAVEVLREGADVEEVHDRERGEDQVGAPPLHDRDREPQAAHEQRRPEPVPETDDERDRRDVVVLEAEPPLMRQLLHAVGIRDRGARAAAAAGSRRRPAGRAGARPGT